MKSYTDIEQSKKLAEILPLVESADMYYPYNGIETYPEVKNGLETKTAIPCWSLAALLNALPQSITKYINSENCQKTFHLNLFRSHYCCVSYCFEPSVDENTLYCIGEDNWIDACYEMILKLHKLKIL